MKLFYCREIFPENYDFINGLLNLKIIMRNRAGDPVIGFLTKSILKPYGSGSAMPTAWELTSFSNEQFKQKLTSRHRKLVVRIECFRFFEFLYFYQFPVFSFSNFRLKNRGGLEMGFFGDPQSPSRGSDKGIFYFRLDLYIWDYFWRLGIFFKSADINSRGRRFLKALNFYPETRGFEDF